jgi:hypothetical protein
LPQLSVEPPVIVSTLQTGTSSSSTGKNITTNHHNSVNRRMHTPIILTPNITRFTTMSPYPTECMPSPCTTISQKTHNFDAKNYRLADAYLRAAHPSKIVTQNSMTQTPFLFFVFIFSFFAFPSRPFYLNFFLNHQASTSNPPILTRPRTCLVTFLGIA